MMLFVIFPSLVSKMMTDLDIFSSGGRVTVKWISWDDQSAKRNMTLNYLCSSVYAQIWFTDSVTEVFVLHS